MNITNTQFDDILGSILEDTFEDLATSSLYSGGFDWSCIDDSIIEYINDNDLESYIIAQTASALRKVYVDISAAVDEARENLTFSLEDYQNYLKERGAANIQGISNRVLNQAGVHP